MEIVSVISNHLTWQRRVDHEGLDSHHLPITAESKLAQDVSVVDHKRSVDHFIAKGQDIESRVLGRAVKDPIAHRVQINVRQTVIFK